jgi:hypothetical protein
MRPKEELVRSIACCGALLREEGVRFARVEELTTVLRRLAPVAE